MIVLGCVVIMFSIVCLSLLLFSSQSKTTRTKTSPNSYQFAHP